LLRVAVALMALGVLAVGVFAAAGTSRPAEALFSDRDGDSVTDVTEVSAGSDPGDPHSTPEDIFPDSILGTNLCSDGLDNDGDSTTDTADDGCTDADEDFLSDNMEEILGSDPDDGESFPEDARFDAVLESLGFKFFETCANAEDDDGDGATDAADSGCDPILSDNDGFDDRVEKRFGSDPSDSASVPEHDMANPGSCSDGIDNDRDGDVDGAEVACRPAANDSFDSPRVITSIPYEDAVKITSATAQPGEPDSNCFFEPQATVWYRYAATSSGPLSVDTAGSNFPNDVAVWTREGNRFRPVTCASGFAPRPFAPVGARASFQAAAGETYYIQVAGAIFPEQPADLRIRVDVGHPPANDNFGDAQTISSLPFHASLDVADATVEFGEPQSRCSGEGYFTVWYKYAPTSEQLLVGDTRDSGYPAGIAIFTDSQFGLTEVACSGYQQRVALQAEAGRTYFIQIASQSENFSGQLQFDLEVGQSPANDDFANATSVTSTPFEDTVDAFTATRELGEPIPSCSFEQTAKTIWYRFQGTEAGFLTASVSGAGGDFFPSVVAAYQGDSLGTLTELSCANAYFGSGQEAAFQVMAGQTYYIQAAPFSFGGFVEFGDGTAGIVPPSDVLTIRIERLEVPTCAPSEFSVSDPTGDIITFGAPAEGGVDVTSVSGGDDGANYCLRVQFAEPLPPPPDFAFEDGTMVRIAFDTDSNHITGYGGDLDFPCDGGGGREVSAFIDAPRDVLVPLSLAFPPPLPLAGFPPQQEVYAFALYSGSSMQVVVPMHVLGDDNFRVAISVANQGRVDCVPNGGGALVSPRMPQPGDANCDGAVNSLDSSMILQRFAGLYFRALPCEYAGDVNQNGSAGPIDAVLILQYSAGMIDHFTPEG
jgi:hypothetical protein